MSDEKNIAGEARGAYGVPILLKGATHKSITAPTLDELVRCVEASGQSTAGGEGNG